MGRIFGLLCGCALALAFGPSAAAGPGLFVGAAEDASRSPDLVHAYAKMELARLAGLDAIRSRRSGAPARPSRTRMSDACSGTSARRRSSTASA